jgi:hypothetical protein
MFDFFLNKVRKLVYYTSYSASRDAIKDYHNEINVYKNIELKLQMNALESTAKYVKEKLYNVPSFESKFSLLDRAINLAEKTGLFCEFGVYTGETINYIAKQVNTVVHGFDSFEGLPEYWRNGFDKGTFALEDETQLPSVGENVKLHVGWFDETLPSFIEENSENISFLHIDCDLYSSTKTIFKFLQERIKSGTVIVFDEYFNYPFWQQHEFKAFQEFVAEENLKYQYICYHKYNQQVVVKIL